ncbi:MAG: hypothetical protein ACM3ML_39125 [Micromonosporaceae bacterium]
MIDITEILIHWHAGRSKNQIASSLGVRAAAVASRWRRARSPCSIPLLPVLPMLTPCLCVAQVVQ